jgi:hypothetical protein
MEKCNEIIQAKEWIKDSAWLRELEEYDFSDCESMQTYLNSGSSIMKSLIKKLEALDGHI